MNKNQANFQLIVDVLRALAEPTRCRLLILLSQGELTVGEMVQVLGQSQPRISRHLKLLSDAGVLERFREEQRIYYQLVASSQTSALVSQALAHFDLGDPIVQADREQLAKVRAERVSQVSEPWAQVRQVAESTYSDQYFVTALLAAISGGRNEATLGELLDVGTGSGSLLSVLSMRATRAVGLDQSTEALRLARARVHGAGLNHCVFKRGDMYQLPFEANSFDTVCFDQVLSAAMTPILALKQAVRVMKSAGRIIVIEDGARMADLSMGRAQLLMRRWFEEAGVRCKTVSDLRAGQRQILLGLASRS